MEKFSAFGGGERELLLGRDLTYHINRVVWDTENGQWQIFGEVMSK